MAAPESPPFLAHLIPSRRLADHTADWTMLPLAAAGLVTGTAGAIAAWVLLRLIALATNLAWFDRFSTATADMAQGAHGLRTVVVPVLGSVAIGLMARFGSEKIRGHGIPEAIEAILFGESRLSLKVAVLKPLSSAISIGSGGPFGAEGPIIMTGGAIGSLFAQCFHLSAAERKTLLVAGAAAGMTAIFGTPLAAVLLAVEVLLFEWKPRSLVPVAASVLTAFAWRPLLIGGGALFPFQGLLPAAWPGLPLAVGLGLAIGVAAAVLSSALYRVEDLFHRLPVHWMWWPALGGLVVGLGGMIEPRVLGAGYGNIADLLAGSLVLQAIVLLLVVKAVVWTVALGSGTSGGVLAPLLILGGAMGAIVGHALPGSDGGWALVGMAAMMSAAMRAPLTGAVFAVELTGRIEALPITLAAAGAAYALAVLVLRRSILTEKIARRGRHIQQEYGIDPLALATVGEVMTQAPQTLPASMPMGEAIAFFEWARHRAYPIVDAAGRPVGLMTRADALRRDVHEAATLGEVLSDRALTLATPEMTAGVLADLMVLDEIARVPVVDARDGRLLGIVARSDLLRQRLRQHREDSHREGLLRLPVGRA
jgi:chloride channel protein, CIC family